MTELALSNHIGGHRHALNTLNHPVSRDIFFFLVVFVVTIIINIFCLFLLIDLEYSRCL